VKSISDVVSGAGLAGYAEVALIIFFLVFVAIGLRVVLARKTSFAREASLPLDDGSSAPVTPSAAQDARGAIDAR
jgi:cbb3-type cytochrome oxidase subunit 3